MFVCRRCGVCCRWPGCVKLDPDTDPERIAAFLGIGVEDFIDRYCTISTDRLHLVLIERPDRGCVFLSDAQIPASCAIEPVKPRQCRDFPDHWNFPGWEKECPGNRISKFPRQK